MTFLAGCLIGTMCYATFMWYRFMLTGKRYMTLSAFLGGICISVPVLLFIRYAFGK